jgi:hypothetical protein
MDCYWSNYYSPPIPRAKTAIFEGATAQGIRTGFRSHKMASAAPVLTLLARLTFDTAHEQRDGTFGVS